ncbi:hypothetical protein F4809DRAFT_638600 [Biscogniauxia mediterranea]|nr:hypothetical protein F4809DRAFT_638600 [Biscogniauxia mediterranea]
MSSMETGAFEVDRAILDEMLNTDNVQVRLMGEYTAMLEIHKTLPTFAPKPYGYGKCYGQNAHFFVCDYLKIEHGLPDPSRLGKRLAELSP